LGVTAENRGGYRPATPNRKCVCPRLKFLEARGVVVIVVVVVVANGSIV
jgi:hypothetical protein